MTYDPEKEQMMLVAMPSREEIMNRLSRVDDNAHFIERLYPKIARDLDGRSLYTSGVVLAISLAIHDYAEDLPGPIGSMVSMRMGDFLEALIDDEDALNEAKAFLEEARTQ